jgi:DNA-binding NarL/FixJ family response regulator
MIPTIHCRVEGHPRGSTTGNELLERIQILVVDMPLLLRDLIEEAVVAQPDMHLLASVSDPEALVAATAESRPDFVLLGVSAADADGFPPECLRLLDENPRTKALGIEAVDGRAYLYELRPERTEIGEVAPEDVVRAIREAAARPRVA